MKILIITPMQEEFDFFLQAAARHGFWAEEMRLGRLPAVQLPELGVSLACGGLGKTQFGIQTQHLLDTETWNLVICAGVAGALAEELAVGDVVAATKTIEHDYHNKFTLRPQPQFEGAALVLAQLRGVTVPAADFRIHFGPIASGDEDIIDVVRGRELREATAALAVAWEGAGGARACLFSGTPFVEIRGVTDNANHTAPADFETNLELAMRNLAAFVIAWRYNQQPHE